MELKKMVLGLGVTSLLITFVPFLEAEMPTAGRNQKAEAPVVSSAPVHLDELVGLEGEPIVFLDNSPSDQGCCTFQRLKGYKNDWQCSATTRRDCMDNVKKAGLEREYQRWSFYKNQSCKSVLQCK